jgi:hypothetical protein
MRCLGVLIHVDVILSKTILCYSNVGSHRQARDTKIYTLRVDKKRTHPRLKTWSSAWLASSGTRGIDTGVGIHMRAQRVRKGVSDGYAGRGGDASPGNR